MTNYEELLKDIPPLYGSKCQCGHIAGQHRHMNSDVPFCKECPCEAFARVRRYEVKFTKRTDLKTVAYTVTTDGQTLAVNEAARRFMVDYGYSAPPFTSIARLS